MRRPRHPQRPHGGRRDGRRGRRRSSSATSTTRARRRRGRLRGAVPPPPPAPDDGGAARAAQPQPADAAAGRLSRGRWGSGLQPARRAGCRPTALLRLGAEDDLVPARHAAPGGLAPPRLLGRARGGLGLDGVGTHRVGAAHRCRRLARPVAPAPPRRARRPGRGAARRFVRAPRRAAPAWSPGGAGGGPGRAGIVPTPLSAARGRRTSRGAGARARGRRWRGPGARPAGAPRPGPPRPRPARAGPPGCRGWRPAPPGARRWATRRARSTGRGERRRRGRAHGVVPRATGPRGRGRARVRTGVRWRRGCTAGAISVSESQRASSSRACSVLAPEVHLPAGLPLTVAGDEGRPSTSQGWPGRRTASHCSVVARTPRAASRSTTRSPSRGASCSCPRRWACACCDHPGTLGQHGALVAPDVLDRSARPRRRPRRRWRRRGRGPGCPWAAGRTRRRRAAPRGPDGHGARRRATRR